MRFSGFIVQIEVLVVLQYNDNGKICAPMFHLKSLSSTSEVLTYFEVFPCLEIGNSFSIFNGKLAFKYFKSKILLPSVAVRL